MPSEFPTDAGAAAAPPADAAPGTEGGSGEKRPSLASLFVTPLVVVGPLVVLAAAFLLLFVARENSPDENLDRVVNGGANERWQAAFELQRQLQDPETRDRLEPAFADRLAASFTRAADDDARVRVFLALALGYLGDRDAVPTLVAALESPGEDPEGQVRLGILRALGAIRDPSAVPAIAAVLRDAADAGLRVQAANALGNLPGEEAVEPLERALADPASLVRWNAALGLAAHDRASAIPHLLEMLDRGSYAEFREGRDEEGLTPAERAIVLAIRGLARLRAAEAVPKIEALARSDRSPRVQDAAMRALETLPRD